MFVERWVVLSGASLHPPDKEPLWSATQNAIGFLSIRRTATNWPEWFSAWIPAILRTAPDGRGELGKLAVAIVVQIGVADAVEDAFVAARCSSQSLRYSSLVANRAVVPIRFLEVVRFGEPVG